MEHLEGIIDKERNPFCCDSWIEQGYPCTPHRKRQLEKIIDLSEQEIRTLPKNDGAYVAFIAIRWGIAKMDDGILVLK